MSPAEIKIVDKCRWFLCWLKPSISGSTQMMLRQKLVAIPHRRVSRTWKHGGTVWGFIVVAWKRHAKKEMFCVRLAVHDIVPVPTVPYGIGDLTEHEIGKSWRCFRSKLTLQVPKKLLQDLSLNGRVKVKLAVFGKSPITVELEFFSFPIFSSVADKSSKVYLDHLCNYLRVKCSDHYQFLAQKGPCSQRKILQLQS